jgi:hypothetical protein
MLAVVGCYILGLAVIQEDGTDVAQVTNGTDSGGAWRP